MGKDNYHHGDVKNRLLQLAIKKLEQTGVDGLSIRELSRELGVSKNAPYRHFKNKGELLSSIANYGFQTLKGMMEKGFDPANSSKDNLLFMGRKYIEFARLHPGIYKMMFTVGDKDLLLSAEAFNLLVNQLQHGINRREFKSVDPLKAALSMWAYIHGCSLFYIDNILLPFGIELDNETFFDEELLFNGL